MNSNHEDKKGLKGGYLLCLQGMRRGQLNVVMFSFSKVLSLQFRACLVSLYS